MATPRKYPTLGEFEELKEAVTRIEAQLARKPARVVYHPRRTERDDYVLVAFGDSDRWFRVNFLHT